eukprot:gene6452-6519_t
MDPMSDILGLLQPSSYGLRGLDAGGDWAITFAPAPGLKCQALQTGQCWLEMNGATIRLEAGDLVLVAGARRFSLFSDAARMDGSPEGSLAASVVDRAPIDALALFGTTPPGETAVVNGGGSVTGMGGYFKFADNHAARMLDALPPLIHIRAGVTAGDLLWPIARLMRELRSPLPGGALMAQHLAQTLLIEALRLHLAKRPAGGSGWLHALGDPRLHQALAAMHAKPGKRWTLAELATIAGMSRTSFAGHFRSTLGETAMEYLTRWRMLLAADRLQRGQAPIATIALGVGYESESAFGAAFKRVIGSSPGRFIRTVRQAGSDLGGL